MDPRALHKISYGLYIITSRKGDQINGQIANTVFQISNEPPTIAVSITKKNLTHEFIKDSKLFAVSVLAQDAPLSLIGNFGFKSGREVNKFEGVDYQLGDSGLPHVTTDTLAYLEARVLQEVDAVTHTIFIGEVTAAEVLKDGAPMTYAYYHEVKRGSVPKTAPSFVPEFKDKKAVSGKYECSVCGYVYDPAAGDPENGVEPGTPFEALPESWVCPVCGVDKASFKLLK